MCNEEFPMEKLNIHASYCNGKADLGSGAVTPGGVKRKLENGNSGDNKMTAPASSKTASIFNVKRMKSDTQVKPRTDEGKPENDETTFGGGDDISPMSQSVAKKPSLSAPLAERMRPVDFTTYSGQDKSLGPASLLRTLLEDVARMPSLVVWGPPGCGKTSLANIIATRAKQSAGPGPGLRFVKMSAVTCGVAEVKEVVKTAKTELAMFKRRTILFLDEVHRFNKSQQDHFLPHIEAGTIVFIGATTENPSFSLNSALLSRCKLVTLEKLSGAAVRKILTRALQEENVDIVEKDPKESAKSAKSHDDVTIHEDAVEYLCNIVDGDARAALTYLEMVINNARSSRSRHRHISAEDVGSAVSRTNVKYDRKGDQHYFMASALQKSIRGSDPSAALYWLGRMLRGGEDPAFIGRRLVRCAAEDVDTAADPGALSLAVSAMQGAQLLGRPECDLVLASAANHLARAPKSHRLQHALEAVYRCIDSPGPGGLPDVPLHLRQGGGKVGQQLGWGEGYSFDLAKVQSIEYLPPDLRGTNFFK